MNNIVASFFILTFSAAGICVICSKLVVLLVEQSKFWGRRRLAKLIPIIICLSASIPQIIDLVIYAAEVVPSILIGQPAYGPTVHSAFGWFSNMSFYGAVLQLLVLSMLNGNQIVKRKLKFQNNLIRGALIISWLISAALATVVHEKICHYTISVIDYFSYQCDISDKNIRLATLSGTFCGALLLLVTLFIARNYYVSKTMVQPTAQSETHASFTAASGTVQLNLSDDNAKSTNALNKVVRHWNQCLRFQLILCLCRTASTLLVLTLTPQSVWFGLLETLLQIIYCLLSSFVYLNVVTNILNYMLRVEMKNAVHSSLAQFRKWSSRRSLHNSFRESCQSFRESQRRSKNTIQRSVIISENAAHAKLPLPDECFLAKIPDLDASKEELQESIRPGIPIIQVEVYRNKEDTMSLCNYEDSQQSLRERTRRLFSNDSGSSLLGSCGSSYSSSDNVDSLVSPDAVETLSH